MHCPRCDYPLWNLKTRKCPECGAPFQPDEFEFIPNSVRFCCPHCDTAYYGRDLRGHLAPRAFACVGCKAGIRMNEMVVRPAEGVPEAQTQAGRLPWVRRGSRGRLRAFLATVRLALVAPSEIGRGIRASGSVGAALLFAWIITAPILTCGFLVPYVVNVDPLLPLVGTEYVEVALWMISVSLAAPGLVVAWALSSHAILRLSGPCGAGLDGTVQTVAYSAPANLLSAIPCLGILGWVWWAASCSLMLRQVHRISAARATMAASIPPASLMALLAGAYLLWMAIDLALIDGRGWSGGTSAIATDETEEMTWNVKLYGSLHGGAGPEHALGLLLEVSSVYDWPEAATFCSTASRTRPSDIPVAGGTYAEFLELATREQWRRTIELYDALPENIVAHRFGDFVFVHHGADLTPDDPSLWLVVMLPDPAVNPPPAPSDPVDIGLSDYTARRITYRELAAELEMQNEYRATLGLPPLPDLTAVTHDRPAVDTAASGQDGPRHDG